MVRFRKAFKSRYAKLFLNIEGGITRGEVPDADRQIEAKNRQIEQLQNKLSKENPREALWEREKNYSTWEAGKYPEIAFWRGWLASRGLEYPEDYRNRLNPEYPLQQYVTEHLDIPPGAEVSILDVGAGPLTKLGTRWEGRTVRITAVDVLAKSYEHLLAEFGITPRVRTGVGEVEQLTEFSRRITSS